VRTGRSRASKLKGTAQTRSAQISEILWPADLSSSVDVWVILDAARSKKIYPAFLGTALQKSCLYAGDLASSIALAAPYLVRLARGDEFTNYIINNGWGNAWGIFLRTGAGFKELRRHLRGFLRVHDELGRRLIFRYYDPRVLRIYLPTCWPAELKTVFGPVNQYLMESDDRMSALEFGFDGQQLSRKEVRPSVPS
jgi:hypothetical protein